LFSCNLVKAFYFDTLLLLVGVIDFTYLLLLAYSVFTSYFTPISLLSLFSYVFYS